jgi:hypothetical protein
MRAFVPLTLAAILALGIAAIFPASAADDVSLADLKAATRSLGFLQNLQRGGTFTIGIVYPAGSSEGKVLSQQVAERLRGLAGPNASSLKPEPIAIDDLADHPEHLNALYLVPGASGNAQPIIDVARRRHLLVMSNDPTCLDQRCCMLMVRDAGKVEIVMDSDLAQSAGISFSSVFAMMVKHK